MVVIVVKFLGTWIAMVHSVIDELMRELERMNRRIVKMFEDLFEGRYEYGYEGYEVPRTEVHMRDEYVEVIVDMPGIPKEGVRVKLLGDNSTLVVEGEGEGRKYRAVIRLPVEVDAEGAEATMRHGVLTIKLPIAKLRKARTIPVS